MPVTQGNRTREPVHTVKLSRLGRAAPVVIAQHTRHIRHWPSAVGDTTVMWGAGATRRSVGIVDYLHIVGNAVVLSSSERATARDFALHVLEFQGWGRQISSLVGLVVLLAEAGPL